MASIKRQQILESIAFCEKNGYFEKLNEIYSTFQKESAVVVEIAVWSLLVLI